MLHNVLEKIHALEDRTSNNHRILFEHETVMCDLDLPNVPDHADNIL